jgi:lactoylglutathione lyase
MRILHTMLRVGDLDRSLAFYTEVLGMHLNCGARITPTGRFTLAFVGFAPEAESAVLELTHNWDTPSYDIGSGFGHLAIDVADAYAACDADPDARRQGRARRRTDAARQDGDRLRRRSRWLPDRADPEKGLKREFSLMISPIRG